MHPRDVLLYHFMQPLKLSSYKLAKELGITAPRRRTISLTVRTCRRSTVGKLRVVRSGKKWRVPFSRCRDSICQARLFHRRTRSAACTRSQALEHARAGATLMREHSRVLGREKRTRTNETGPRRTPVCYPLRRTQKLTFKHTSGSG